MNTGGRQLNNCDVCQVRIRVLGYTCITVLSLGDEFTKVKDHILFTFVIPIVIWCTMC